MKAHLCTLFYILGCILLAATTVTPTVKMQTYSLAIPPLKRNFFSHKVHLRSPEIGCLADVIYHEARGESIKTQVMVAEVAINRVKDKSGLFPYTICKVVHQQRIKGTCQFSWFCTEHHVRNERVWHRCRMLAEWIYLHYYRQRDIPDLTKGSLYFATVDTHRGWMNEMEMMVESGKMKFLASD